MDNDHQLWELERVSRTSQEVKDVIRAWKPELLNRLVQSYGDDIQYAGSKTNQSASVGLPNLINSGSRYFVLPSKLRETIWDGTKLLRQSVRKGAFDYDDFVIKVKDAVNTWARDRLRKDVSTPRCLHSQRI